MKFIVVFLILIGFQSIKAGNFGLGVIVGSPTGISLKYKLSAKNAIDGAVAFRFEEKSYLHLIVNYLFTKPNSIKSPDFTIGWYWGAGLKLLNREKSYTDDDLYLGPRVTFGINHFFTQIPLEIFAEVGINLLVIPGTSLDIDAGIGARFYF